MVHVFGFENAVLSVAFVALLLLKGWALVDAMTRRPDAFVAASRLTKPAWLVFLALALVTHLLFGSPLGILSLVGTVAAFVYLLDVRPALVAVTRK